MSGSFAFVDNFAIDQRSRKQIRSHVMKGKNTTRARNATGRRPNRQQVDADSEDSASPSEIILHNFADAFHARASVPQPFAQICGAFAGVHFPVAIDDREQLLVRQCP